MNISISDYNQWLACPQTAWWRHKYKTWVPPSRTLRLGTALHKYMESLLLGRPEPEVGEMDPEDARWYADFKGAVPPDFMEKEGLKLYLHNGAPAVEIALSATLRGVTVVGRLDGIVQDSVLWSSQWKSVGRGKPIGGELAKILRSHHEMTYQWLARENGIELAGTLLGTFRKLSKKDVEAGTPVFSLHRLHRDMSVVDEFVECDLIPNLRRMVEDLESDQPPRNWLACFGPYGNSRCPLFDMCHLGIPGDCLDLAPMEERYSDLEGASTD